MRHVGRDEGDVAGMHWEVGSVDLGDGFTFEQQDAFLAVVLVHGNGGTGLERS